VARLSGEQRERNQIIMRRYTKSLRGKKENLEQEEQQKGDN